MKTSYYGWGLPFDASVHGAQIDRLIYIFHGFMAVLFIGWFAFLIACLVRFRQRPGHQAIYNIRHFNTPTYLETGIALFEGFLLFGLAIPMFHQVRMELPPRDKSLEVRVIAEQFAWNIHYPGSDGLFGKTDIHLISPTNPVGLDRNDPAAKDDITTINQLHIPIGKPIIVQLTSKDVIHSFFLPVMRVKQDAIPGMEMPVWFEAKKTGQFEIACAQLCGLGHYRMRGFFTIHTPEEFETWWKEQTQAK